MKKEIKRHFKDNSHRLYTLLSRYGVKDLYSVDMYVKFSKSGSLGDFNEDGYRHIGIYPVPYMGKFDDRIIFGDSKYVKDVIRFGLKPIECKVVSFYSVNKDDKFRYVLLLCK